MKKYRAKFKDGSFLGFEYEKVRQNEEWFIFTKHKEEETYIAKAEVKYITIGASVESDNANMREGL